MKTRIILMLLTGLMAIGIFRIILSRWEAQNEPAPESTSFPVGNRLEFPLLAFQADMGRLPTEEEGLRVLIVAPIRDKARWRGPYIACTEEQMESFEYRLDSASKNGFSLKSRHSPDLR